MTQHYDHLGSGIEDVEIRPLTPKQTVDQLRAWHDHANDSDDTEPLSKAEIAQKLFEGRALRILADGKMTAGYFFDLPEIQDVRRQVRGLVGEDEEDEILGTFLVDYKHLFS